VTFRFCKLNSNQKGNIYIAYVRPPGFILLTYWCRNMYSTQVRSWCWGVQETWGNEQNLIHLGFCFDFLIEWQKLNLRLEMKKKKNNNVWCSAIYIPTRCTCHRVYFCLRTALHVWGFTVTHLQEHKTTVTTASGNHYTVIDRIKFYF